VSEELLDKLTDFIEKYLPYRDRDLIKDYIKQHKGFHTIDYAIDKGDIVGICRWNISDDGKTAFILDLAIREDFRHKGVARDFLIRGLRIWKNVTHLQFKRGTRGDDRQRRIPIEAILKRGIF
jgi:GNAT superfamily N-acetyltransferase